jgi:hypothetical protein
MKAAILILALIELEELFLKITAWPQKKYKQKN